MSRLPFELFLALRYLRPKRTFVSVITVISAIGVTLGVAVLIIVISVMSGFDQQLRDKILGFKAHLRVYAPDTALTNYAAVLRTVASNPNVKSVAPVILGQVLVKTQPEAGEPRFAAPVLRGVDLRYETNVYLAASNVVLGEFDLEGASVLLGSEFARAFQVNVGDRLAVYSPNTLAEMERRRGKADEEAVLPDEFIVRGIFDVGYYEYNANVLVTSLQNAQDLYRLENRVHSLQVMLHDPLRVAAVRRELARTLDGELHLAVWTEDDSAYLDAVMVEKNVMFFLLFFITIVAAFGIMNSQITFVVQKTREIGALKALGAARSGVLWLFLSQSLAVGAVGVLAGYGLGMLALAYRNEFLHSLRHWTGLEIFPASIYGFSELPALISPRDIGIICGSALVACVVAGLVPAWNAAKLRPVEALRHE